ncbi:hypothetical protein K440DRAFT_680229 [Wilcoxina mikolae CBS 423.85]|nr:hypothetical protein K440DRAFT_680229 [Wilcoxina mikolae CBS 423.85]
MANLASTYRSQERWKEAEVLQVQVMETRKRVLGQEHPDTLTNLANLAYTYKSQGRINEAIALMVKVETLSFRVLGKDHPNTKNRRTTLANWREEIEKASI